MKIVGAALAHNLDLRSGVAAVGSIVRSGDNGHGPHRLLIGRDHRRAAVRERVHAHTIDHEVVISLALAGRGDLNLVFGLKDSGVGASRTAAVGKKDRLPVSAAGAIAGNARRRAQKFIGVGTKSGQSLNLFTIDRRPDARIGRLQQRNKIAVHLDRFRGPARLQRYVQVARSFGSQGQVCHVARAKSLRLNLECVLSRR